VQISVDCFKAYDIRLSSKELSAAVAKGISDAGAEVMDIQLSGTEMVYFATSYLEADGGIMVTASHNPADYDGLKIVREMACPVSEDSGLVDRCRRVDRSTGGTRLVYHFCSTCTGTSFKVGGKVD
jgi:hypothetical protein